MLWKGLTLNPTNIKLYFIKPGLFNILQRSLQLDQQKNLAFSQKPEPLQRTYVFLLLFFLVESLLKRVRQSLDRFSCKTKTKIICFTEKVGTCWSNWSHKRAENRKEEMPKEAALSAKNQAIYEFITTSTISNKQ